MNLKAVSYIHWQRCLEPYGGSNKRIQTVYYDLVERYNATTRHYHNLNHIDYMLRVLATFQPPSENFKLLFLATWFHDTIYDVSAGDNEEQSANFAVEQLHQLNLSDIELDKIHRMICFTTHDEDPGDAMTRFFVDADLSLLAVPASQFRLNSLAIRREYSFVSNIRFRSGRIKLFSQFLERERIYYTPELFDAYELLARRNMQRDMARMSSIGSLV